MTILPTAPIVILARPQMGENVGAAARAMWNFELNRMRIVAPRDGWPNPKAVAMASGAGRLLDEAQLSDRVIDAVADCTYVFATTARHRGLTKPIFSPERAMELAREKIAAGERVAVLFGPERAGLENEDVAQANAIISVPVNPEFASLNQFLIHHFGVGILLVSQNQFPVIWKTVFDGHQLNQPGVRFIRCHGHKMNLF